MVDDKAPQSSNAAHIRFMRLTLLFYLYCFPNVRPRRNTEHKHVVLKRAAWPRRGLGKPPETEDFRNRGDPQAAGFSAELR